MFIYYVIFLCIHIVILLEFHWNQRVWTVYAFINIPLRKILYWLPFVAYSNCCPCIIHICVQAVDVHVDLLSVSWYNQATYRIIVMVIVIGCDGSVLVWSPI